MKHPYGSEAYARAFASVAEAVVLPSSGIWVLARPIAGTSHRDLIGCYPRTAIHPDAALDADLCHMSQLGYISLAFATDAFVHPEPTTLRELFDVCRPFKQHYLLDCRQPFAYTKHHRYEVKRALRQCTVERIDLIEHMGTWLALYRSLVQRRTVTGLADFPDDYFNALVNIEELFVTAAKFQDEIVGIHLWMIYEQYVYSHLGASSEIGYRVGANYALYDDAIQRFGRTHQIDFGGSAGATDNPKHGLARFKQGFANSRATAYLCGKILDTDAYHALCTAGSDAADYFPAYRAAR